MYATTALNIKRLYEFVNEHTIVAGPMRITVQLKDLHNS